MNIIKRNIFLLTDSIQAPICIVEGSDLYSMEFTVRDFNIPEGASAVAYAAGVKSKTKTKICEIDGNIITLEPTDTLFEEGFNMLQIRIFSGEKSITSFNNPVHCHKSIVTDDASETESDPTLLEQILSKLNIVPGGEVTPGTDGGYYKPTVDTEGNLSWKPSKTGMPGVESVNIKGEKGKDGVGIQSVEQTTTSAVPNGSNVITVALTNGQTETFTVKNGAIGATGAPGVGVQSIEQTVTSEASGGRNTVEVRLSNGNKSTFYVYNGKAGVNGAKGETGVGISTVKQTTTSTEDDGKNFITVTKTDGSTSTFSVKNGSKGSTGEKGEKGDKGDKGDTGAAGKDGSDASVTTANIKTALGYTPAKQTDVDNLSEQKVDKTDIVQEAGESESLLMSQGAVTKLVRDALGTNSSQYETVDSVEEMTDTTKSYVLSSTGTIWTYGETEPKPNFTNLATTFEYGRFNSYCNVVTTAPTGDALPDNVYACMDFIPFETGDVVRVKGFGTLSDYNSGTYKIKETVFSAGKLNTLNVRAEYSYDESSGIVTAKSITDMHFIRFSGILTGTTDDVIITCNEEITYSAGYEWYDTGMTPETSTSGCNYVDLLVKVNENKARIAKVENRVSDLEVNSGSSKDAVSIPSYWETMVANKTEAVKALQAEGGKDCISFAWASDTHIPDSETDFSTNMGVTAYLGRVMAKMLDNCEIPFAVLSGDINTRASYATKEAFMEKLENLPEHLAPLWGTDRLLMALGNHDGAYGDSSAYYRKQLPPEEMWQVFFRSQALDFRRVFSDDGLYFYVDNIAQKTRFIILNSHFAGNYTVDSNGLAVNNRFATSCYGQEQLDWLADVALDLPEGYSAIITAHAPMNIEYTVDKAQLIGIINAYCNKTIYSGSYSSGVDGWTNSEISVDFTNAKGEIIAVFAGHVHWDKIDTTTLACPLITIIAAGATVNEHMMEEGEVQPTRTRGTDTETSFDVVTINKKTRTIYCTRVGGGSDRVINY